MPSPYTLLMMQFGFRAHDFGRMPIERLARTLHVFAPVTIQLALTKALDTYPDAGQLSPGYARRIRKVLESHDIDIAVLGCYINPVHPDDQLLDRALARFEEHLVFCADFGCRLVGTETGSYNPDGSFHPETASEKTFDRLTRSVERLVRTAEKFGALVGIEPVADTHVIGSVASMARLLARIDSPNLRVIHDPVNLLPSASPFGPEGPDGNQQRSIFLEAFDAIGEKIAAVHLKDFTYHEGIKSAALPALTGHMDVPALLSIISERKGGIDILLENTQMDTAALTLGALKRMATLVQ